MLAVATQRVLTKLRSPGSPHNTTSRSTSVTGLTDRSCTVLSRYVPLYLISLLCYFGFGAALQGDCARDTRSGILAGRAAAGTNCGPRLRDGFFVTTDLMPADVATGR